MAMALPVEVFVLSWVCILEVTPSLKFNSAAVAVTPSKMLSSAAVLVTPSRILSSAVVLVTPVSYTHLRAHET